MMWIREDSCYNYVLRTPMRMRLAVSGMIGIVAGALTWLFLRRLGIGGGDFNWAYDAARSLFAGQDPYAVTPPGTIPYPLPAVLYACLLYTSDAADERSGVDLGGRRI